MLAKGETTMQRVVFSVLIVVIGTYVGGYSAFKAVQAYHAHTGAQVQVHVETGPAVPEKPLVIVSEPEPEPKVYKFKCSEDDECLRLAEAIYFEAGIEPFIGKIAVAHVVLKRVSLPHFPNTIEDVIYNLCHFTYTCNGDLDKGIIYRSKQWKDSLYAAELVLSGLVPDPTNGADHYFNPQKVERIPRWSKVYPQVAVIGRHQFHKRNH